ncbi:MAG TPA: SusC/RagA family TonB-linked outer membrane protein [Longimicrobiales bacterium]|nr:SusC/RagA family TonB-linked outer membrane protein [Longimicrobiales bacterium]
MDNFTRSRLTRALGVAAAGVLLLAPGLVAQTGSIAGRVTDAQSGSTIPAAQVFIQDLDIGVLTQQNGSYILLNVPAGPREVTVQRIGFRQVVQTATVVAGQTAVLDFRITEEALQLDEVIVTGTPGGTARRAIGNAVTTVSVADVTQDVAISNFQDLLSGRTPGVQFTALGGNVGTGSPIRIRGVSTFTLGAQPLIVVDGVRVNNATDAGPRTGESGGAGNPGEVSVLNDFNPEDIESIEIIKGPAAASLYGTEASAGVIQIITKKGRQGAPEFNVSVRQGVNYMSDPAGRLGTYWTCENPGASSPTSANACTSRDQLVPYNMYDEANNYIRLGYFPYPTENLFQNGHTQGYNVDVRGGTEAVNYFLSANYDKEEGFVYYNVDETFRLRANVGVVFNENFSLDVSTSIVDGSNELTSGTISDGSEWQDLVWSNGTFLDRITPFGTPGSNPRLGGFQEHLPSDIADTEATRDYTRFTGSATLNFRTGEFNLGSVGARLTQRAVLGLDKGWDINRNLFLQEDGIIPQSLIDYCASAERIALTGGPADCAPTTWGAQYTETSAGEMHYQRPINTNYSFDYALGLALDVSDDWSATSSVGAQYYVRIEDTFKNSGQGFASLLSTTINQISQSRISTEYEYIENKSLGLYVQQEIGWRDRLFLTGALRFDDNSTFGTEAPAQKYPKVSGTWVVSEEGFWNFDLVNSLRVRGAWGKAGRQPSALAGFNVYAAEPGPGGAPAIRPSSPGNPGVEPEIGTELEVGFDVALLDDRLSGEFTYYKKKTENVLLGLPLSDSYGFPGNVDTNVGRIDNWGWEAQLSARVYESDAFSFDVDFAGDHTDNEIKDIGDYAGSGITGIQIGMPWPNRTIDDRVVQAEWNDSGAPLCTAALLAAGTECQYGANAFGRGVIAYCDVGVSLAPEGTPASELGKYGLMPGGALEQCGAIPDRRIFAGRGFATYTWSVAPRVSLLDNQLQIFALAEGQYGRLGDDSGHLWGHNYNSSAVSRVEDDAWWVAQDRASGTGCNFDKCMFDASFWKLREVGFRYNLPQSIIARTGASRASLAFSARNIWTIWRAQDDLTGLAITDPEYGDPTALTGGGNFWSQPPLTNLNMTLRVTF